MYPFLIVFVILGVARVPDPPLKPDARLLCRKQPPQVATAGAHHLNADTLDLPTVEEARQMIVGTWIDDVASEVCSHRKGAKRWVFTDGGTVRKYRNGELYAEQDYEIVQRYDEMQDPDEIVGYLKFTRPSGEVYYATLTNIERGKDPILYVKHHGPSVPATLFVPPDAFE